MEDAIDAVRRFNRFYTRRVGALNARFLGTELSLPEARLATDLQKALGMDAGYLSRVLRRFETRGWIRREAGEDDARRRPISVTPEGQAVFELIDQRQRAEVAQMLEGLAPMQRGDVVAALGAARALLGEPHAREFALRTFRAGDLGWLCDRQAEFYLEAYGWGRGLELNVMEAATGFLRGFREGRDQGWIAEVNGARAGSVLLTDEGDGLSRLRLLYVEPMARGRGVGEALVTACIDFARQAGYRAMTLWTHEVLTSARRIYAAHGFEIVATEMHEDFGKPELGETWLKDLTRSA
jgi:DNA-binding MarR family transcriptional regulator/ribosomal protein S18 acetylase RimI-like enzyme